MGTLFVLAMCVAVLQGSLYLLIVRLQAYREWRDRAPDRETEVLVMAICGLVSSGLLAASGQGGLESTAGVLGGRDPSPLRLDVSARLPPVPPSLLSALPVGPWPASLGAVPSDVGRVPAVAQRRLER